MGYAKPIDSISLEIGLQRMTIEHRHLLEQLKLPDRFEDLRNALGDRLFELVVEPSGQTTRIFERASLSVKSRGSGLFSPILGGSGAGKTTLANSLSAFISTRYTKTANHKGEITFDSLNQTVKSVESTLRANETRVIPVNIDDRESDPPTENELNTIKRFLRGESRGSRCVVLWPVTRDDVARQISDNYQSIAGQSPIETPIPVNGPSPDQWQEIVSHTLALVNDIPNLSDLGVRPEDYDPHAYPTIGEFLRAISTDFNAELHELLLATRKPIRLIIAYASESYSSGVLSELTSGSVYGLLDSRALLDATSQSDIGKWWSKRRGLLTQTIMKLDARAYCLPPATSTAILAQYGPKSVVDSLSHIESHKIHPYRVREYLSRTDIGKYLADKQTSAYEARGRPPERAIKAVRELASSGGFQSGKDKTLNEAMCSAISDFLSNLGSPSDAKNEKQLSFTDIIPDNAFEFTDRVICIEYAWRSGDFLVKGNRSKVAQYALQKLRNYAETLGWVAE